MSEQLPDERAEGEPTHPDAATPAAAQRTGNVSVDRVLDSLEGLEDMPVDEHVAVFESAHDRLRKALDSADSGIGEMPRPNS